MRTKLGQYFGDASDTTFDLPRALTSGYVLDVQVNGESVDFAYSDADTVVLSAAPASKAIIDFWETNEIKVVKTSLPTNIRGNSAAILKTTAATTTLLPASGEDRFVMIHVKIDEEYELGTGTLPTVVIGQTGTTNKFMPVTALVDESNVVASPNFGADRVFSGVLSAGAALIITSTAAVGDSTGGCTVSAIAVPAYDVS